MDEILKDIEKELMDHIQSINYDEIIKPTIPLAIYLQEAENIAVWANEDINQLTKVGITPTHIEDLKRSIDACRMLHTEWLKIKKIKPTTQKHWEESKQAAIDLRNELIFAYRYAFRKEEAALKDLKMIQKQNKTSDLVVVLIDLSRIGKTYSKLLEKISFDFNKLTIATQLAFKLRDCRSNYIVHIPEKEKIKVLRNQSYTYLKHLLDEIKNAGKYVFAKNQDRLEGYHFKYYKNKKTLNSTTGNNN